MAVYTEIVKLKDEISEPAKKAAHEADLLEKAIKGTQDALVKAQALGNVASYKKLKLALSQYKASLDQLPKSEIDEVRALQANMLAQAKARKERELGDKALSIAATKKAKEEATVLKASERALASAAKLQVKEEAKAIKASEVAMKKKKALFEETQANIAAGLQKENDVLKESIGQLGAMAGAATAAVAVLAGLVVGLGAAIVAGAKFAIESRAAKLEVEGFYEAMSQGLNTGSEVDAMVESLSDRIGIAKDTLEPFTKELMKMGITALPELEDSLLAVTSATALMGKSGGDAFFALTQKIQSAVQAGVGLKIPIKGLGSLAEVGLQVSDVADLMGISAKELAAQLKAGTVNAAKFGDAMQDAIINKGASALDRMAASIGNIKAKFMTDLGDMFEDIDVAPFLAEVKELFTIFSQAKPSGQALKAGIGGFFTEVFRVAKDLIPTLKHFFLDLIIWGLKAYIALKPIVRWFQDSGVGAKLVNALLSEMKVAAIGVGVGLAYVVAVGAGLVAGLAAIGAGIIIVKDNFMSLMTFIGESVLSLAEAGASLANALIDGLTGGIFGGFSRVGEAVTGLAESAKNTFKNVLGIASPSKVMFAMGENIAQGASMGIESGVPDVHGAATTLAAGATQGMGDAKGGSSSRSIQVFAEFNFGGGGAGGQSATELTEQAVALIFERVALEAGL